MSEAPGVSWSVQPDLPVADMAGPVLEEGAGARSRDTFATFRQKQCAMAGALNQSARAIEKLIRHPFKRNAAVGAAIDINIGTLSLADHHQHFAVAGDTQAARVSKLIEPAQRYGKKIIVIICHELIISASAGQHQQQQANI
tara:strand:- start:14585 stop:15010 length:426 start_codon:yes stop_codon:yes gene_type:complete